MEITEFTPDVEKLFVQFMYSDMETFVRVKNILKPSFFDDPENRSVMKFIMEYTDDHPSMPTTEQVRAITGIDVDPITDIHDTHVEWFMDNVERFCKQKAAREAVHKSIDLIKENRLGEVVQALREANELGIMRNIGTDYFRDPKERLEEMLNRKNTMSTGWKHIDEKLYGGFNRGELNIFAGQSGSGKSLFLQNLALNWAQMGLNVVYLSLELSEELCSMRLDSMTTGYGQKEIMRNLDDVSTKVGMFRLGCKGEHGLGSLQIKQLPTGCTSTDIRTYVKEYEIQNKKKVDALLIDYLDLCMPANVKVNPSDQFIKDKFVSEDLRNVAVELDCLMATASQLNRNSHLEIDFDHSHIAGGISKINTADNVMAIFTTISMKESGRYQIQFLKTRSSAGVGSKVDLKFDSRSLRITDLADDEHDALTATTANVLSQLKRQNVLPSDPEESNNSEKQKHDVPQTHTLKKGLQLRDLVKRTSTVAPRKKDEE